RYHPLFQRPFVYIIIFNKLLGLFKKRYYRRYANFLKQYVQYFQKLPVYLKTKYMNKTIRRELIKKSNYRPHLQVCKDIFKDDAILSDIVKAMKPMLEEAAKDLLSPRPEAVAQLLRMADSI